MSNIFPLMGPKEFNELKEDISQNGLMEPVYLYNDLIIDGRNRYLACKALDINPEYREWTQVGDLVSFIVSLNLHRRHLSESQRAMIGAKIKPMLEEAARERSGTRTDLGANLHRGSEDDDGNLDENFRRGSEMDYEYSNSIEPEEFGRSSEKAAELVNVSPRSVAYANKVIEDGIPELSNKVMSDEIAVSTAALISETAPEEQKELIAKGEKEILKAASQIKRLKADIRKAKQVSRETELSQKTDGNKKEWTVTENQKVLPCDAVITDPPYGILNEKWEPKELQKFTQTWAGKWNACKAEFFLIFWSQEHLFDGKEWFDASLKSYQFQQLLIWHYPNNKSPQSRKKFKQTWEPIFFYRKKESKKQIMVSGTEWGDEFNDFDCHVAAVPQSNFKGADMKQHPAQKPLSVMKWLVNATTQKGELVCDPFAGSGTTGIASVQLGRRFHGIETDPEYIKLAKRRIGAYAG